MATGTIEEPAKEKRVPVQATVINHDPYWRRPIIPVFPGITGWSCVQDDGFPRWFARPGAVVLGVWSDDWHQPERSEDEIAATDAPAFEVVLPLAEWSEFLHEARAMGQVTLAVLEFPAAETMPPEWGHCEVSADGLDEIIREACRLAHDGRATAWSRQMKRKPGSWRSWRRSRRRVCQEWRPRTRTG